MRRWLRNFWAQLNYAWLLVLTVDVMYTVEGFTTDSLGHLSIDLWMFCTHV